MAGMGFPTFVVDTGCVSSHTNLIIHITLDWWRRSSMISDSGKNVVCIAWLLIKLCVKESPSKHQSILAKVGSVAIVSFRDWWFLIYQFSGKMIRESLLCLFRNVVWFFPTVFFFILKTWSELANWDKTGPKWTSDNLWAFLSREAFITFQEHANLYVL